MSATVWRLAMALGWIVLAVAGCASGSSGPPDGEDAADGLPASPRPDGATLLFSPVLRDDPSASAQNPAFSPDGSRIVFTLFLNGYNAGPAELWIMEADGANPQRITPVEDQDSVNVPGGAWNAARDEIVFASDRQDGDDLWSIGPDGSGLRRITSHAAPPYWREPVWSPDGAWIVFEADTAAATELAQRGTIFKVRSDGTDLTQLTKRDGEDFDDRLPSWSPAGDQILFQRRIPPADGWDVYTMDVEGDGLTNISNAAEYGNTDNSWSPDGRWIAGSSAYPTDGEALAVPNIVAFFVPPSDSADGVEPPVRITRSADREDGAPSVSPDGRRVAFESHRGEDEDSPSDLWIIATPADLPAAE